MVPIDGKYMPTHISNKFIARKVDVALPEKTTKPKAMAAIPNTIMANCSGFIFSMAIEKIDDPAPQITT